MSFNQILTSVSIISSGLKSYQAISLTNFVTSAASLIASGSAIEIANAFFLADGNITPNASSWTAVGTGNTAYLTLTPSGSAGSQVLSAAYTDTAPTWVLSKAGWYASAASVVRYIGGVLKESTNGSKRKFLLHARQEELNNTQLVAKVIDIGSWNMVTGASVTIPHGLSHNQIRTVFVAIRKDVEDETDCYELGYDDGTLSGYFRWDDTNVYCTREPAGQFTDTDFSNAAVNRGWITIWYEKAES